MFDTLPPSRGTRFGPPAQALRADGFFFRPIRLNPCDPAINKRSERVAVVTAQVSGISFARGSEKCGRWTSSFAIIGLRLSRARRAISPALFPAASLGAGSPARQPERRPSHQTPCKQCPVPSKSSFHAAFIAVWTLKSTGENNCEMRIEARRTCSRRHSSPCQSPQVRPVYERVKKETQRWLFFLKNVDALALSAMLILVP